MQGYRAWWLNLLDSINGWILVGFVGLITALIAYCIDVSESVLFDLKGGYCSRKWIYDRSTCCKDISEYGVCEDWTEWSSHVQLFSFAHLVYLGIAVSLAVVSALLTLFTRSVPPPEIDALRHAPQHTSPVKVSYLAAGSGIPEVKTVLSGFVIRGFLGLKVLGIKAVGLTLSVASGLSLGKEGPFVHIACCVGNVLCRFLDKYHYNDGKRREVLSAASAAGVAVAFGAPIGGVLFSLEEVSYYFSPKTMWRSFFCAIIAAMSLKFLNPHGTGRITLFEVSFDVDWRFHELFYFVILGLAGGVYGAYFCKFNVRWTKVFRQSYYIKKMPVMEVFIVTTFTAIVGYTNHFTRIGGTQLVLELFTVCSQKSSNDGLCPTTSSTIQSTLLTLLAALCIKIGLTIITFGMRIPAGIFIPTMTVGALMGRMLGLCIEWLYLRFSHYPFFLDNVAGSPAVYASVGAAAALAGVTRMTVSLAVIMFELTGSLNYLIPFMISILVSKWVADALEREGIYDLVIGLNNYPYLDHKRSYLFTSSVDDLLRFSNNDHNTTTIDISVNRAISALRMRMKISALRARGIIDGGFPILQRGILLGYIASSEVEHVLNCTGHDGKAQLPLWSS